MTEEEKEILLAKMLGAPASLSDEELSAIMGNEELRELYELSVDMHDAIAPVADVDAADEWRRFKPQIRRRRRFSMKRIASVAAAVAALAILIGVAGRMIENISFAGQTELLAEVGSDSVAKSANNFKRQPDCMKAEVKAGDVVVETQQNDTTTSPPVSVENSARPSVKPADAETVELDVDEYLRIRQAQIDNDVAMALAEVYADEAEAIDEAFDSLENIVPQTSLSVVDNAEIEDDEKVINCILI